jgi:hypothetical protein
LPRYCRTSRSAGDGRVVIAVAPFLFIVIPAAAENLSRCFPRVLDSGSRAGKTILFNEAFCLIP